LYGVAGISRDHQLTEHGMGLVLIRLTMERFRLGIRQLTGLGVIAASIGASG